MSDDEWTIERHLDAAPQDVVGLYRRFAEMVEACGPVNYAVSKSAITFKGRRRGFAGARPKAKGLVVYLDLQRRVEDHRISRVDPYTRRLFVHHLLLTSLDDFDSELAGWVAEAYAVGDGRHLDTPR